MRFRAGLLIGFGTGYYLGTMAGRERYEQIQQWAEKLKRSETFETASEKARSVVDLGVERAQHLVDSRLGNEGNGDDSTETSDSPYYRSGPT